MKQKNPPGYPLPPGELGEDEIVCQLVYLPDRPEYWQALLAGIHYFSTWRAWEHDDNRRGKDAAENWREAFELTIGCWRMTCLDEITDRVDEIIDLISNKKDCCDDNITYLPTEEVETQIDPGAGDPPETYGQTEVADWDEWNEHLCYNAHKYVDYLATASDNLWIATRNSAITIGLIAALLALLAASGVGLPIAFATAAAIVSGIALVGQITIFDDTKENIEAARDEIVCAIMTNSGLATAVETALGSATDWDVFFQFIPYSTALAILYEGGHNGEYLPENTKDDCEECDVQPLGPASLFLTIDPGTMDEFDYETREFVFTSESRAGCQEVAFETWEADPPVVKKNVHVVVTSCTVTATCSSLPINRGYDGELLWSFSVPHFPTIELEAVNRLSKLHHVATPFTFRVKLFEA